MENELDRIAFGLALLDKAEEYDHKAYMIELECDEFSEVGYARAETYVNVARDLRKMAKEYE